MVSFLQLCRSVSFLDIINHCCSFCALIANIILRTVSFEDKCASNHHKVLSRLTISLPCWYRQPQFKTYIFATLTKIFRAVASRYLVITAIPRKDRLIASSSRTNINDLIEDFCWSLDHISS